MKLKKIRNNNALISKNMHKSNIYDSLIWNLVIINIVKICRYVSIKNIMKVFAGTGLDTQSHAINTREVDLPK